MVAVVAVLAIGVIASLGGTRLRQVREAAHDRLVFSQTSVSTELPRLSLLDLQGNHISTESVGKKQVLLFFDTGACRDCLPSYPFLEEVAKVMPVVVVASGPRASLVAMVEKRDWKFPVLYDSGAVLRESLSLPGVPSVALVDSTSRIVRLATGRDAVPAVIRYLLRQWSPSAAE